MKNDILNPGFELTLRPMRYPQFYKAYKNAVKSFWTVEEVKFEQDVNDLRTKLSNEEKHLIERLVAFFATGDTIVANNAMMNLYRHLNSPEVRMAIGHMGGCHEMAHTDFYLTLLDTYITDPDGRAQAFAAIENIPSIHKKAEFCAKWMGPVDSLTRLDTEEHRRAFLRCLLAVSLAVEGLFFFGAFAYVYWFRSRGLLPGLAAGTNYIFREESSHIQLAIDCVKVIQEESPHLFDARLEEDVRQMIEEAVECETQFAQDVIGGGLIGLSLKDMRTYLEYVADQRLTQLGYIRRFNAKNPFDFMELQDVQELTNFFERRVSAYQMGIEGEVEFEQDF
jgi:ribonucleoside-diphosphate reductase beta chain